MCVGLSSQPRRATSTLSSRPCYVRQVLFVSVGYQLKYYGIGGFHYDLAVDDTGHTYAVALVSFFIVTRTNISYGRYMEGRALLGAAMRSVREISQTSAALTVKAKGPQWAEWRGRVSRRAALLLRALACVLHHPDERERVLAMPCLLADEQARLRKMCPGADKMRPVLVLALWLRRELASAPDGAVLSGPAASSLQGHVNEFITSYHGLMNLSLCRKLDESDNHDFTCAMGICPRCGFFESKEVALDEVSYQDLEFSEGGLVVAGVGVEEMGR